MKRVVLALVMAGGIWSAILGLAASLDVSGGSIQAGADTDLVCDEDGVHVVSWNLDTNTGLIDSVRIGGIDVDCQSGDTDLFVNLTHLGFKIAEGQYDNIDASEVNVPLNIPMSAWNITDIEVFIEGGANG